MITVSTYTGEIVRRHAGCVIQVTHRDWKHKDYITRETDPLENISGTSLLVQWLRLCAPNAGGLGLIPGQGPRSHMPQEILRATTKTG